MRKTILTILALGLLASSVEARDRVVQRPERPAIEHIFLVIMENQNFDRVMQKPFAKRLAAEGALLANFFALQHPSQPNYIALAAGSTWGVNDDATADLDVRHLGDLLDERAIPWKVYAERYPGNCFLGHNADNLLYVRRHVPFLGFKNVQDNKARCAARVVNANVLDADIATRSLPAFAMYIPDQQHNSHDTDIDFADAWLESKFGPLLKDPRFTDRMLFILTWDESSSSSNLQIATIFWGPSVKRGAVVNKLYNHYDLLRTIEALLRVPTLGQEDAKQGEVITGVFQDGPP